MGISLKLSKTLQRYENKSKSQPKRQANRNGRRLSKTLQRYENKSKSQPQIYNDVASQVV